MLENLLTLVTPQMFYAKVSDDNVTVIQRNALTFCYGFLNEYNYYLTMCRFMLNIVNPSLNASNDQECDQCFLDFLQNQHLLDPTQHGLKELNFQFYSLLSELPSAIIEENGNRVTLTYTAS